MGKVPDNIPVNFDKLKNRKPTLSRRQKIASVTVLFLLLIGYAVAIPELGEITVSGGDELQPDGEDQPTIVMEKDFEVTILQMAIAEVGDCHTGEEAEQFDCEPNWESLNPLN